MARTRRIHGMLSLLLAACLTIILLPAAARAATPAGVNQGFTVTNSGSTFTITRSDASAAETVRYRTVSLSALEGQNFTAVSGTLTFAAGEISKTVSVTERTATGMFQYAAGLGASGYRQYRFEVLDLNGFLLTSCTRSFAVTRRVLTGAMSGNYDLGNTRNGTFYINNTGPLTITDDGYNKNPKDWPDKKYMDLPSTTFYDADTQAYLVENRAELRMTLDFYAYEAYDGYQYVQLLTDNTTTCDSGAGDGNPGTIQLSRYMAGFEIQSGSAYTGDYKRFTFPVLNVGNNAGHTNPWGYGTDFPLSKQKFNQNFNPTTRAADGRILLNTNFNTLVLRFDASGSDKDNWCINNINAHVTAVDTTAPTVWPNGITLAPGPYNAGNTFYVSVPFTEIVIGRPTLITSWGEADYIAGSSTNVLAFQGTVPADTSTPFSVTGFSGTLPKDLFENVLGSTAVDKGFNLRAANPAYAISCDLAGGSAASANPTSYTWDTQDFTLNNPTREGYTFDGWTGSNGDTPEAVVTIPTHSHGDRAYIANWTRDEYAITYDLDGGTLPQGVSNPTGYNVETSDIPLNNPSREGYTFVGWTGTDLSEPTQDVTIPAGSTGDRRYIAVWTQNDYTVTAPEAMTGGSVTADKTENVHFGDTVTLTVATETGYELAGLTVNGEDVTGGVSSGAYTFSMPASDVTVSAAFLSEWAALQAQLNAGGTVSMTKDITALSSDSWLEIPAGVTVTLDLNGHTLNRGLTTATNNGSVIRVAGTMILTDSSDSGAGVVTGGFNSGSGGGVFVIGGGSFTMTGGTITGNTASYGGGVNVNSGGSFTMTGGAITNNTAASSGGGVNLSGISTFTMTGGTIDRNKASLGGGVGVGSYGTFRISGSPVITGNTEGSRASNVRLDSGKTIAVTDALADGASIGVTMLGGTSVFTSGWEAQMGAAAPADFFTSDNSNYEVYLSGGEAALGRPYDVTVTASEHGTVAADKASAINGDTVTLTVAPDTGYVLDTLTVTDANHNTVAVENGQFTMPAGDVTLTATFTMTWASLNDALQNDCSIVLPYDVTATESDGCLSVPAGVTVTLDLNGHTLDRGLTEAISRGYVIQVYGTLTLTDSSNPSTGRITGGNCLGAGGGVFVTGVFTMTGGTITGNAATWGGGVYNNGAFDVSGSPVVTGNLFGGFPNNVYLESGKTITLSGPLAEGAALGVRMARNTGAITTGWAARMGTAAPEDFFTSDNSSFAVYLPDGEAALGNAGNVIIDESITHGTVTADATRAVIGRTVTLTATPDAGYMLDILTVKYYGDDVKTTPGENNTYTFTMPDGRVNVTATFKALPAFGDADFTLPGFLTAVEEEAFEGIAASVVEVPEGCVSIGDHAFRNCPNLTRIRVPAGCDLGEDVFDGCAKVYIYSAPGSDAEAYCRGHDNCEFVAETQE